MSTDVISRYEAKYLIPERMVPSIRDAIRGICSPDKHVDADGRYTVNNLYFDTPDLRFYHDTKFKRYTRFKPRVRFYGTAPKDYLWVELKHKLQSVTWKKRRRIRLEEWADLFDGIGPGDQTTRRVRLTESFEDAVRCFQARPIIHVRYVREPYVSDIDDYGRITFDRRLSFRAALGSFDLAGRGDFVYYDDAVTSLCCSDDSPVILEIKTETQVPVWVLRLIQRFELSQRGFSKYCYGIDHCLESACMGNRLSALA